MFNKVKYFAFLMVVMTLLITGCSEDTTLPVDSGSILRTHLESNDLDLDNETLNINLAVRDDIKKWSSILLINMAELREEADRIFD